MTSSTRENAKAQIIEISERLAALTLKLAEINTGGEPNRAVLLESLERIGELRRQLDELTINLLIDHLSDAIKHPKERPCEQTVEETRAFLARFFDIL